MDVVHIDMPMLDTWGQAVFPLASSILGAISKEKKLSYSYIEGSRLYVDSAKRADSCFHANYIEQIVGQIFDANPSVITISINQWNQVFCYEILRRLLQNGIKSDVIIGGPQVILAYDKIGELLQYSVKEFGNKLFLGVGEAEIVYNNYLDYVSTRSIRKSNDKLSELGIYNLSLGYNGKVERQYVKDMADKYYFPDYDGFGLDYYFSGGTRKTASIEVGRGCVNNCTFCAAKHIWGRLNRRRPVEYVINEIKYLKERSSLEYVFFSQDNLLNDIAYVDDLMSELVEKQTKVRWGAYATMASVTDRTLDLFGSAMCDYLFFGFESGSALERKQYGITKVPDNYEDIIQKCQDRNITPVVSFIVRADRISELNDTAYEVLRMTRAGVTNVKVVVVQFPYGTQEYLSAKDNLHQIKPSDMWGEDMLIQDQLMNDYLSHPFSKALWPQIYHIFDDELQMEVLAVNKNILLILHSWFVSTVSQIVDLNIDIAGFFAGLCTSILEDSNSKKVLLPSYSIDQLVVINIVSSKIKQLFQTYQNSMKLRIGIEEELFEDESIAIVMLTNNVVFREHKGHLYMWTFDGGEDIECFNIDSELMDCLKNCFGYQKSLPIKCIIEHLEAEGMAPSDLFSYLASLHKGGGNEDGEEDKKACYCKEGQQLLKW